MSGPVPPYTEVPVYIEFAQRGDHYNYDQSNTSVVERRPLYTNEVWLDAASVPAVPPTPAAYPGGAVVGFVQGISSGVQMVPVPGNAFQFQAAIAGRFSNMVPGNFSEGAYKPTLTDADGAVIPYDPSVWAADGVRQLIEFKYKTPSELGYTLPLAISYWRYVGTFPGPGGGLSAVDNVGLPGGDVWESTTASTAHLRRLIPDPLAANAGIAIANAAQNITIGNTMTGVNLGPASNANVFSAKNGANLEFRRLTAGANMIVTQNANDIVLAAIPDGGVTSGNNLGVGAEVFKDVAPPTQMNFRTLIAGPTTGLGITQDLPVADEIQITADEVDAAGTDLVPALLNLFVNAATGNDTTGTGTALLPFRTLDRAFRTVRVVGYDDTATITIQAAGGTLALPNGIQSTNKGTRGRRRAPLALRGERTLAVATTVAAVSQDATTGFYDVTLAAGPVPTLGQIIRFTSGPINNREFFIAEVVSLGPAVVRIPWAGAAPTPGNSLNILNLASMVSYVSSVIEGDGGDMIFQDLRFVSTGGLSGQLRFVSQNVFMTGVWIQNNAGTGILSRESCSLQIAGSDAKISPLGGSTLQLGAYLSNTGLGHTFLVTNVGDGDLAMTGVVCQGNGQNGNFQLLGRMSSIDSSYFAAISSVTATDGPCQAFRLWFQGCAPLTGGGALEADENAAVTVDRLKVAASTENGVRATLDGVMTLGSTVEISSCAAASLLASDGGHLVVTGVPTLTAGPGTVGYQATNNARLTSTVVASLLVASGFALAGFLIEAGSKMVTADGITANGSAGDGLVVVSGSEAVIPGTVTAGGNAASGVVVTEARLVIRSVVAVGNFTGVYLRGSHGIFGFAGGTGVVCTGSGQDGILLQNSTLEASLANLALQSNGRDGLRLENSTMTARCSVAALSLNTGYGLYLARATLYCTDAGAGIFNVQNNVAGGIQANDSTTRNRCALGLDTLTCTGNAGVGADFAGTQVFVLGAADFSSGNVGATGALVLGADSRLRADSLTANLTAIAAPAGTTAVLVEEGSSLVVAQDVTVVGDTFGANAETAVAVTTGARLYAANLTATALAGSGTAVGVVVSNGELRLSAAMTVTTATAGLGLWATTAAIVAIDAALVATGNGTNVLVQSGSKVAASDITATVSLVDEGISATDAAVSATNGITVSNAATVGLSTERSAIVCGATLVANNCVFGLILSSSTLKVGGNLDAMSAGNTGALLDTQSAVQVGGDMTVEFSAGGGLVLDRASALEVSGGLLASTNVLTNVSVNTNSVLTVVGSLVANSSGVTGLDVFTATVRANSIDVNTNATHGIDATTRALVVAVTTINASGGLTLNVSTGIRAIASHIHSGGNITASTNGFIGLNIATQSVLRCSGGVTTNGNLGFLAGTYVQTGSTIYVQNSVVSSNNSASGFVVIAASGLVGGVVANANAGGGLTVQVGSHLTTASDITTTGNNSNNITVASGSQLVAGGAFTGVTATGSVTGYGIAVTGGSTLNVTFNLTATGNALDNINLSTSVLTLADTTDVSASVGGDGIHAVSSVVRAESTVAANNCTTGAGIYGEGSDLTFGLTLTTNSNQNGIELTQSRLRYLLGTLTANSNTVTGILAQNASVVAINGAITMNGAVGVTGIILSSWSALSCAGNVTISNVTTGIDANASSLQISGALSIATCSLFGMNIQVSRVDLLSTLTINAVGVFILESGGSILTCVGTATLTTAAGSGFAIFTATATFVGALTVTAATASGIAVTRGTLNAALLSVTGTTAGPGLIMSQAMVSIYANPTALNNNNGINLDMIMSTFQTVSTLTANTSTTGNGIRMVASNLYATSTITATGNALSSLDASANSNIYSGGGMTVHNGATGATCVNLSASRVVSNGANTFATAATNGQKLVMNRSDFITESSITATAAVLGIGISLVNRSNLIVTTLNLTGNSQNLLSIDSTVLVSGVATIGTATGGVNSFNFVAQSTAYFFTLNMTNPGALLSTGLLASGGCRIVIDTLNLSGTYTIPLQVTVNSELVLRTGPGVITGSASTTTPILISNSRFSITNHTINANGSTAANIEIQTCSLGTLGAVVSNNAGTDGIRLIDSSRVKLSLVTGAGSAGVGIRLMSNSHATFLPAGTTITGTGGDCLVGVNLAKTWAQMASRQMQHVNDWSFPAGGVPAVATQIEGCSCQPSTI